ncbi:MAG: hypothetical protein ACI9F9_002397 [Candidatus Paceibacteria bacterium]|jgi:hypothetical protein
MGYTKLNACALAPVLLASMGWNPDPGDKTGAGFELIQEDDIQAHVQFLAAPGLEGRGTPSEGQARAAEYLLSHYRSYGLEFAGDSAELMSEAGGKGPDCESTEGSFYRPFQREVNAPSSEDCRLVREEKGEVLNFEYGKQFVPVHRASGTVRGELVFGGFGIDSSRDKYNDYKSIKVRDRIVLLFEGEPRHKKKFDGPEVTPVASLYSKLVTLNKLEAAGALVVRRAPVGAEDDEDNLLDFRYSDASFLGTDDKRFSRPPSKSLPTLIISMDCASSLLGQDAYKLAQKMDSSAKPKKVKLKGIEIDMGSGTKRDNVRHDNLVGILRGTDPELADEYVMLGAHYDHIGVGPRGRVGCGANDNASGCAALLEVMEALAKDPPRRSVIFANFTGEEIGLIGSREMASRLPVSKDSIVCMVNMDMLGFGRDDEVAVLGVKRNPKLDLVLSRAKRLSKTGIKNLITGKGEELWQRSDHYEFHQIGLPVLFFFEGLPISEDKDYHTWRDTTERVNVPKITNIARLTYNTVWLLANDDKRPPSPRD